MINDDDRARLVGNNVHSSYDGQGDPEKPAPAERERTASLASSTFNLANAVLGAGILTFPGAFEAGGVAASIVITLMVAGLACTTLFALCYSARASGVDCRSYQQALRVVVGPRFARGAEACLLLYLFGACVAFLDVIADSLIDMFERWAGGHQWWMHRVVILPVLGFALIVPVILFRNISFLGFTSGLAVVSVIYLAGFATVVGLHRYSDHTSDPHWKPAEPWVWGLRAEPRFFLAFPTIIFAFQCHVLCIPVFAELKNPTMGRMAIVVASTVGICLFLYLPMGICGYLGWNKGVRGKELIKVLGDANDYSVAADIARVLTAVTATFSFPVVNFTARLTLASIIFGKDASDLPNKHYYPLTLIYFLVVLIVAIVVSQVTYVLSVTGASAAVMLMFIFPAILLLKTYKDNQRVKMVSYVVIVLGCLIGIVGVTVTILEKAAPKAIGINSKN